MASHSHTGPPGGDRRSQQLPNEAEQDVVSTGEASSCLCAIIENRAKEVGIAAVDQGCVKLSMMQFVETSRTYATTLSLLESFSPAELLIVASHQEVMSTGLNKATRQWKQIPVARSMFDDTKGALLVTKAAAPGAVAEAQRATQTSYYLSLGAAGALLRFLEQEKGMIVSTASMDVQYVRPDAYMHIDMGTVESLELIRPLKAETGPSTKSSSLFRFLNHTKTRAGERLLRVNILQPLTDIQTIRARQQCLSELLGDNDLVDNIVTCLGRLPKDMDKMCGNLAFRPQKATSEPARRIAGMVGSMILLKEALLVLPALAGVLEPCTSSLLTAICSNCNQPAFQSLLQQVESVMDEDAQSSRTPFINRTQQCFAVKKEVYGFLDLARATFCSITEQIHQLADQYRTQYRLQALKVNYNARRGFDLKITRPQAGAGDDGGTWTLPADLIQLDNKQRGVMHCTTHALNALNSRLKDASNDCLLLTEQVLEGVIAIIAQQQALLQKLIDSIALLDMLCAFAHVIACSADSYAKPNFSSTGPIAILEGRHPVLEQIWASDYQANDTYLADCSSFHILSGPNMSGKSTYLRQVAVIVVMAQIGCYVPATFAAIRPVDRLFTRIGTSDSIETNSSSFMTEMQETAYIIDHATDRSLVIIDELGRATSTADGTGIAWAVSEHLICKGTFTLFATHFARLAALAELYPSVKLWHLDVDTSQDRLDFTWVLKPGAMDAEHYGLLLAGVVGIPLEVIEDAQRVAMMAKRDERRHDRRGASAAQEQEELAAVYAIAHKVACIAHSWSKDPDAVDLAGQLRLLKREASQVLKSGKS